MREILFRAWDKENQVMIKNYAHMGENGRLYVAEGSEHKGKLELMQWTGLVDCKGNKIFEGDIIRLGQSTDFDDELFYQNGEVIYAPKCAAFYLTRAKELFIPLQNTITLQVIGNIYENPELTKD